MKTLCILPLLLSLNSCFEEDIAVSPFDRGDITSNQVDVNVKDEYQLYFDLSTNSPVSSNLYGAWDLGFQSYDSYYIRLNTARNMNVVDLGEVDFTSVDGSTKIEETVVDVPSGNLDSTAIGKWWNGVDGNITSKNHTYIIDRGRDQDRVKGGKVKLKILSADADGYRIIYSKLDDITIDTIQIPRKDNRNFVTFSFENRGVVNDLEPPSDSWDLLLTKYIELFDVKGFEVYPVTGVLINTRYCKVAEADSLVDFSEVTSSSIAGIELTTKRDEIGWDWKQVDINTGVYTVNPSKKYIIRDTEGFIYKLRFIGFQKIIDEKAEKGFPEFEFKLL